MNHIFSDCITNELHKQHLNLSGYAWNVIDNDRPDFYGNSSGRPGLSTFLNHIFLSCYELEKFPTRLTEMIDRQKKHYMNLISGKAKTLTKENQDFLVSALTEDYQKTLKDNLDISSKGSGRKFTLNKKSYELLCSIPDNSYEAKTFKSPGKYLKAIFEAYAKLPYLQREEIFFHETLSELEDSIRLKRTIRITTGDRPYEVIPYLITTDTLSAYHYLVGLSHPADAADSADLCASFRISRIQQLQINRSDERLLKPEEKKELEKQISEKGVQFLLADINKIRIRLTDEGVRKYHSQVHLRPPYKFRSEDNIFEFQCTSRQIEAYFFKFGKDAEILEPLDLKEKFAAEYKSAADLYENKMGRAL